MEDLFNHLQEFCRNIAVEEFQRLRDNEVKKSVYSEKPLNVSEAAKYLNVATSTLYRYVAEGQIPHSSLGKQLYFFEEDIIAYLKQNKVKSKAEITQKVEEDYKALKSGRR